MRTFTGCTFVAVVLVWLFHGWLTGSTAESIIQSQRSADVSSVETKPTSPTAGEQTTEPYGGCDEALGYPGTEGHQWCKDRGLLPGTVVKVSGHDVLIASNLPPCLNDEPEGGPCLWNADQQGNGDGTSFWLDEHNEPHYLWPTDPTRGDGAGSWKWVDSGLGDALAEGSEEDATTRRWTSCIRSLTSGPLYIYCPDGLTIGG